MSTTIGEVRLRPRRIRSAKLTGTSRYADIAGVPTSSSERTASEWAAARWSCATTASGSTLTTRLCCRAGTKDDLRMLPAFEYATQ
jgi:hypothetical protein